MRAIEHANRVGRPTDWDARERARDPRLAGARHFGSRGARVSLLWQPHAVWPTPGSDEICPVCWWQDDYVGLQELRGRRSLRAARDSVRGWSHYRATTAVICTLHATVRPSGGGGPRPARVWSAPSDDGGHTPCRVGSGASSSRGRRCSFGRCVGRVGSGGGVAVGDAEQVVEAGGGD